MRFRDALRRAVGYHLRALPPTVAGLGIAGAGVWYGLDGGTSLAAVTAGRLAPTAALVATGVAVAAVGRTAVRLDANAAAVAGRLDGAGVDADDLRETVALATERAVADSVEGATAEIEARVTDAVDEAFADADGRGGVVGTRPSPPTADRGGDDAETRADADDGSDRAVVRTDGEDAASVPLADALDARSSEPDALADATRRASERVESYLQTEDAAADDVGEFRQLAEGATVMEGSDADAPSEPTDSDRDSVESGEADGASADAPVDDGAGTGTGTDGDGGERDEERRTNDGAEILDDDPTDPDLPDGDTDADDAEIIDGDTEMVFGDVRDSEEGA